MSVFKDAVSALEDKEAYIVLGNNPVKVTISNVVDDLVVVKLSSPLDGASELSMHISNLVIVSA